MNTDDLIDFLSTHVEAVDPRRQDRVLLTAILGAFALALAVTVAILGVRPDLGLPLLASMGFLMKIGFLVALAAIGLMGLKRAARAGTSRPGVLWMALVPLGIVWLAAMAELARAPLAAWPGMILAPDWKLCLVAIPVLSLIPLAILVLALREGAPTQLPYCGALLGLLAGGIGALAYASFCIHDTAVYIGLWYATAIAFVTFVGWLAGPRLLRW